MKADQCRAIRRCHDGVMTPRERITAIIAGAPADRTGFWLGQPTDEAWQRLHAHCGTSDNEALRRQLGCDLRHVWASSYFDDEAGGGQRQPWAFLKENKGACHAAVGPLAGLEDPEQLEALPWPDADDYDFSRAIETLRGVGPYYRASGLWTCFYHDLMDAFGMEEYLVAMYEKPELVEAATDRICGFYFAANERFLDAAGDEIDGLFIGNDFGTQLDTICAPEQFDRFILPWFKRFADLAHAHGKQFLLHSCGSIARVIDRLVEAGTDCLHPLQAKAAGMAAEDLARDWGGRVAFMGGLDTQDLLPRATPAEIEAEVVRLQKVLGPRVIISPSHEALLADVPPENVVAMAQAATGQAITV